MVKCMVFMHRWCCRDHANYYMSKLQFDKNALLSRKGFDENTRFCRKMGFIANTRFFGFVWCRLLRRHLWFDSDFAQISGLKIGGWQLWFPDTIYTPKECLLSKKGLKEGERVARGHFRERVDETHVQCTLATSRCCTYPDTLFRFPKRELNISGG